MRYRELTETASELPRFEDVVTPAMRTAFADVFDRTTHGREAYMSVDSVEQWLQDRMPDRTNDPDILGDPTFQAAFETWLRARYREVARKLARLVAKPTIKAWRVLRVDQDWLRQPRRDLGIYWTYNLRRWNEEIGAYPVWADNDTNAIDVLVTAEVPHASVDWLRTIRAHMDYHSGDREFELRLAPGSPVTVQSVRDFATSRRFRVHGDFTA